MKLNVKTWWVEALVVWAALLGAMLVFGKMDDWREWIAAVGVGLGFHHASVANRLQEAEEARVGASVDCVRWLNVYWVGKEVAWVTYFLATGAVSALVGCVVFLLHPFWRQWYRSRFPRAEAPQSSLVEQLREELRLMELALAEEHSKAEAAYARGLADGDPKSVNSKLLRAVGRIVARTAEWDSEKGRYVTGHERGCICVPCELAGPYADAATAYIRD